MNFNNVGFKVSLKTFFAILRVFWSFKHEINNKGYCFITPWMKYYIVLITLPRFFYRYLFFGKSEIQLALSLIWWILLPFFQF